jgi:hypothetical protein
MSALDRLDPRRIEAPDPATIEIMSRMSAPQKMKMLDDFFATAQEFAAAGIRWQHPDWTDEQVARETARRNLAWRRLNCFAGPLNFSNVSASSIL